MANQTKLDLATIRQRLENAQGQHYWRSLDEVAQTEEFQEFLTSEFPYGAAPDLSDSVSRRTFLKLMGASMALAGLTACGPLQPEERIVPYVVPPPEYTPGLPLFFATTFNACGYGRGTVVESHEGRPIHIEGNAKHPGSLGAVDVFTPAEMLVMYDPDRSRTILRAGEPATWDEFLDEVKPKMDSSGKGVYILTETTTSPTLANQIKDLREMYPSVKWHQYDPINRDNIRAGAEMAFDEYVETRYHFDQADIVLSLDANFMACGPGALAYARQFIENRRVRRDNMEMNRLYVVESTPSVTGTIADHRLPLRASQIEDFARMVAEGVGVDVGSVDALSGTWVDTLVHDLLEHKGRSIVIAGPGQPPAVHAVVHAINDVLGNVGKTVIYTDPVEPEPIDQLGSLHDLHRDMGAGKVEVLLIIGGNPVYTAPKDIDFDTKLSRVGISVHLSLYEDETSELCTWHIPQAHTLETWSDLRAYDGTVSIVQPLIAPLYGGKTVHEMLSRLMDRMGVSGYQIIHDHWIREMPAMTEREWELSLQDGLIEGTQFEAKEVTLKTQKFSRTSGGGSGLEIVFHPDPTIWDGRYANNGWLQETPKPLTKITWENAILISPFTAWELGIDNEDIVQLNYKGQAIQGPVWIMPGQADNSITVHLGYGRRRAGQVGTDIGFNAYELRTSDAMWFDNGVEVFLVGGKIRLASTQHHHSIEVKNPLLQQRLAERTHDLLRVGTIDQFQADPEFAHHIGHGGHGEHPSIHPKFETASGKPWEGHAWAIVIDLNACIGCNACMTACQSENNVPIVGKEEVIRGREMHWIRIDRYYDGQLDNPRMYHMPLGCVQCERAPCEPVCPVAATVHSLEGLNDMVYNRCVGTRYCSNNCPYKVRRFNFFGYAYVEDPSLKLMYNPNVTVRTRGVMEKCSYCVQRINAARIVEKREGIDIVDGDIMTACEAACPTQAITFGDMNDPNSRVAQLKSEPHNYSLLGELVTSPRTTYLARVRNPSPDIEPPAVIEHQQDHGEEQTEEH